MTTGAGARLGAAVVLVATVAAAYLLGGLGGPFVFDDREAIVDNPSLLEGASWRELLWPPEDTPVAGRPVVNLSFAVSRALGGLEPVGFRVFNLALHVVTALLLLGLLRRTLQAPSLSEPVRSASEGLAFAGALLWALHPLLSETIYYAVQRTELWFGFFYVLVLYAVACAGERGRAGAWGPVAVLACALGALSKEAMVTAPVLALLYDRTFVAGSFGEAWRCRKGVYLGLFATWAIVIALMVAAPRSGSIGFHANRGADGGAFDYLVTQAGLLPRYLRLLVLPWPLVLDYGRLRPIELDPRLIVQGVLLVALFLGTAVSLVRRPVLGFVGAAFFFVLAPTSSFVPIVTEVGAERRMYVPAMALVVALIAYAAPRVAGGNLLRSPRAGLPVLAFVTVVFGGLVVMRGHEYESRVSIWTTVVERRPLNPRGHYNLGTALTDEGRIPESLASYERAVELRDSYVEAHDNLGNTLAMLGRFDEALVHNRRACQITPDDSRMLANLALTLFASGNAHEALTTIDRSIALDAAFADAHQTRALALEALGRKPEAEAELREAVRLDPNHSHANFNLARMLVERGDASALPIAVHAAQLAPSNPGAQLQAARLLIVSGRGEAALAHIQAAVQVLRATGRGATVPQVLSELATQADATGQPDVAARLRSSR